MQLESETGSLGIVWRTAIHYDTAPQKQLSHIRTSITPHQIISITWLAAVSLSSVRSRSAVSAQILGGVVGGAPQRLVASTRQVLRDLCSLTARQSR